MRWYHDKQLGLIKARDDQGNIQTGYICRGFEKDHGDLISAAPDLLEAAKLALEDLEIWHSEYARICAGCITCDESIPALRGAIQKAEGKIK